jgi:hypothetical protein
MIYFVGLSSALLGFDEDVFIESIVFNTAFVVVVVVVVVGGGGGGGGGDGGCSG